MRTLLLTGVAASGLLILAGTGTSQANALTGAMWEGTSFGPAANVTTVPSGTPTATFVPGPLDYSSGGDSNLSAFLNNPTFLTGASHANDQINGDVFQFTGTIGLTAGANSFKVGHDDGVYMTIAGIGVVVNAPGPTGFNSTPFTVTAPSTGNYNFTLNYGECCGPPADLLFAVNNVTVGTVPEPASMAILGTGLAGLGWLGRRRKRRKT